MTFKQLLIGLVAIITLYSCQSEISNTTLFAGDTWNHFIAKEDTIEITNTKTAYNLDISLEVWDNIDKDLYLIPVQVLVIYPNGQESGFIKQVSIRDLEGNHLGTPHGDVWSVRMNVFTDRTFPEKGKYLINLQQQTQKYDLQGIESASTYLYPHKKTNHKKD